MYFHVDNETFEGLRLFCYASLTVTACSLCRHGECAGSRGR